MNFRYAVNQFCLLMLGLSAVFGVIGLAALAQAIAGSRADRAAEWAMMGSAAVGAVVFGTLWWYTRTNRTTFGRREALLLVAMSWLIGAAIGALPFWWWAKVMPGHDHPFDNYINCYFETMSGFTTTGSTILHAIATVPESLLLWRAMTHWLGGLGIVVLFVAVLPSLGGTGGKKMFRVEAPGPTPEGVRPSIRDTARVLWLIYAGLTIAETIALRVSGVPSWYEAICHTFATLATGGFSTHDASIAAYSSPWVHIVVIVFMFLAGVNFGLYHQIMQGRWRAILKDTELRVYVGLMATAALLIVIMLVVARQPIVLTNGDQVDATVGNALQYGVFTTVSIQTTTGFCNADFNVWPFAAKALLLALMFVGGSAGSTGGGIKVIRIWLTAKVMWGELERAFRPHVVRPVRIGQATLDPEMRLSVIAYVFGIFVLFGLGAGVLMALEGGNCSFKTAATASVATLCNIGPGLGKVGATQNYFWFTDASKIVMCVLMALGRLEVFAIAVLLSPRFWRGD